MDIENYGEVSNYEDLETGSLFICFAVGQKSLSIKVTDNNEADYMIMLPLEPPIREQGGLVEPCIGQFTSYSGNPVLKLEGFKVRTKSIAPEAMQSNRTYGRSVGVIYQTDTNTFMGVSDGRDTRLIDLDNGVFSQLEGNNIAFDEWEIVKGKADPIFKWPMPEE